MHIVADRAQIAAGAADELRFVATAEKVAGEFVPMIEPHGVGAEEPFHSGNEIWLGRFDDKMKMVSHEAVCVSLPTGLRASFSPSLEKPLAIKIVTEDILAMIAAAHDVVNRSWEFDA